MPTIDQIRNDGEGKIERSLRRLDARHRREVEQAIATFGSVAAVPQEVWNEIQQEMDAETVTLILLMMLSADGQMQRQISRKGVEVPGTDSEQLADYARKSAEMAQRMSREVVQTTQQTLADAEQRGELRDALKKAFGSQRREKITRTIGTNSTSAGQIGAAKRVSTRTAVGTDGSTTNRSGQRVNVELIWQTKMDGRVCPICAPLNGTSEEVWGRQFPSGPGDAAHPNCRCKLVSRVLVQQESYSSLLGYIRETNAA